MDSGVTERGEDERSLRGWTVWGSLVNNRKNKCSCECTVCELQAECGGARSCDVSGTSWRLCVCFGLPITISISIIPSRFSSSVHRFFFSFTNLFVLFLIQGCGCLACYFRQVHHASAHISSFLGVFLTIHAKVAGAFNIVVLTPWQLKVAEEEAHWD